MAGDTYVKLALPAGGDAGLLPMFAEKIAAKLRGPRTLPPVLACFPDQGKKPRAEKLIARDFLGHAFLHDAAVVPYEVEGTRFRLFAVEGKDEADVRAMVTGFRKLANLPNLDAPDEGKATLKDPLNGQVTLVWKDHWLWGAVDGAAPPTLIEELGKKLLSIKAVPGPAKRE